MRRADLIARGKIPLHCLAQGLVIGGDALFQLVELRVLVNLPPLAAKHSVGGRGRLPTASGRGGRRRGHGGCAGFLVGRGRLVAGTSVVGTDGLAAGEKGEGKKTEESVDG